MSPSLLLLLLLALPVANAKIFASSSIRTTCENFMVQGEGTIEEVCADHIYYTESGDVVDDDSIHTVLARQTFHILKPVNRTAGEIPCSSASETSGTIVELSHWITEGSCNVTINGTLCDSCEYCNAGSLDYVSADCSVVPGGRVVECESNLNVFYPFEGYVSTNAVTDDSEELPTSEQFPTNPPSDEGNTTLALESAAYHCAAVSITFIVAAVGSILQL